MMEMIEMMFSEMVTALGYSTWYECEDEWEGMEDVMVLAGFDTDEVRDFFAEMEADL